MNTIKEEKIRDKDNIKISEIIVSCIFLQGLHDRYNEYKTHIQNKNEDDIKFMKVKE